MCSWIPFWQIVGIGGTGETWEASMKCELDALSHGHEECEFNNVVMICGETWELNYSRIQQRMVTCHWWNIDMGHGMFSQGKISIELWRKNALCLSQWYFNNWTILKTENSWYKSATKKLGNCVVDPQKGGDLNIWTTWYGFIIDEHVVVIAHWFNNWFMNIILVYFTPL